MGIVDEGCNCIAGERMTNFVSSIKIDDVIDALATFLQPFAPGAEIVRGQVNRTPQPSGDCIVLTELLQIDLELPYSTTANSTTAILHSPKQVDVQIDFYSSSAGDWANAITAAFRTGYGFKSFPASIKPLFCSDARQAPLITGEHQWGARWIVTASMQYNATVSIPMESAEELELSSITVADFLT